MLKRQGDILQFAWPDDLLFDKWMAEIPPGEQFVEGETENEEIQDDETQIIDTITTQAQQKEENKKEQSLSIASPGPSKISTAGEEGKEVTPTMQDKANNKPHMESSIQSSEQVLPLASLAVMYTEDLE